MKLEFDDSRANVTLAGVPIIFMSKSTFGVIHRELITSLGRGAESVLYHAGYEAGKRGFKLMKEWWDFKTKDEIIDAYKQQFPHFGWLNLEKLEIDDRKKEVIAVVKNSFEGRKYNGGSDKPVCHFIRGYLAGMCEAAFGTEALRCDEVKCEARGDDACEFIMKPMFW